MGKRPWVVGLVIAGLLLTFFTTNTSSQADTPQIRVQSILPLSTPLMLLLTVAIVLIALKIYTVRKQAKKRQITQMELLALKEEVNKEPIDEELERELEFVLESRKSDLRQILVDINKDLSKLDV
ncbi:MAG: hypothetical protein ABH950_01690 [Candidatus Altiarchaeota archaeon]